MDNVRVKECLVWQDNLNRNESCLGWQAETVLENKGAVSFREVSKNLLNRRKGDCVSIRRNRAQVRFYHGDAMKVEATMAESCTRNLCAVKFPSLAPAKLRAARVFPLGR